ncbi:hypothetical protein E4U50_000837 [Claviceps purpurea]|nr:hypothetical protein E4U50_000837 [Claviceps purpurea]
MCGARLHRYTTVNGRLEESGNSSLPIEPPEPSPILGLFQPSNDLPPGSNYTHDSNGIYPPSGSIFAPDGRLRLNSQ